MKKHLIVRAIGGVILTLVLTLLAIGLRSPTGNPDPRKDLKSLLPNNALLRDYTKIGESEKFLLLYVLDYEIAEKDPPDTYYTCPGYVYGQPITGEYYLALVENEEVINRVRIPSQTGEKLRIVYRQVNEIIYKKFDGSKPETEKEAQQMSRVHLLNLRDLTGDGKPYEFQLQTYRGGCGHVEVLTAGYSPERDKAVVFPIIGKDPTGPYYWHDNFFPDKTGTVTWEYKCGDHASTVYAREVFEFNQTIEAFVMSEYLRVDCRDKYINEEKE